MTGLTEKIRSLNFVGMSMLLHSSAILAIAVGPHYFPEMMGNHTEPDESTIEFTVLEDSSPVQTLAMAEPVKVEPAPAPVVEKKVEAPKPEPKVAPAPEPVEETVVEEKPSKSNEMPTKDAVVAAKVEEKAEPEQQVAQEEDFKEISNDQTAEALTDDSEIIAQQKREEEERLQKEREEQEKARVALEEKLAAVEAARAAEQAEIEELKQQQEKLAQEKAEAQALAAQAEAARVQQEQEAQALAEQKAAALAAAEKAAADQAAAEAAAAEKVAAAEKAKKAAEEARKGQGAGAGEKIIVDQDFLSLRQRAGNVPPKYTTQMRLKKLEGRGQLVYFVTKQGTVSKMRMTKSTGSVELDNSAIDAFRKYKFVPGQQGYTVHNFEFRLKGPAKAHDGRLRAKNQ